MMFQPCFLAVEKKERISAKSIAPSGERKPPELYFFKLIALWRDVEQAYMLRRIRYVTVVLPTGAIGTREAPPLWHTSPAGLTSAVHDVPVIGILISVPLWQPPSLPRTGKYGTAWRSLTA